MSNSVFYLRQQHRYTWEAVKTLGILRYKYTRIRSRSSRNISTHRVSIGIGQLPVYVCLSPVLSGEITGDMKKGKKPTATLVVLAVILTLGESTGQRTPNSK